MNRIVDDFIRIWSNTSEISWDDFRYSFEMEWAYDSVKWLY
jgi:hypothetical protein